MLKYARIWVLLDPPIPYKDRIFHSVFIWEYVGQRKIVFSHILRFACQRKLLISASNVGMRMRHCITSATGKNVKLSHRTIIQTEITCK